MCWKVVGKKPEKVFPIGFQKEIVIFKLFKNS